MKYVFLLLIASASCSAQFETKLQPQTISEFEQYARTVEGQLESRWSGRKPFLSIDDNPADLDKVQNGEVLIHPGTPGNPIAITDGLVHDWVGAIFIPNAPIAKVLAVLQDFDRHSTMYPSIVQSRLISRHGNDLEGYWRLQWKHPLLTVTLDVSQEAHYREIAPGKWMCKAYAKDISEVERAGTARERKLPPGQGNGFLWRLYAYWSLEAVNGGVLAECRTLSLSRNVPPALAWAINPFIQSLPRDSLAATLRDTKKAAMK